MNCNYKVKITDIQTKYKFKVFCTGYDDSEIKDKIDAMYQAWPKASGEGETPTLDNTANATMSIDLKGNTSQDGTPTPDDPVDVQVVTGDNTINICGKNLFNKNTITTSAYLKEDGTLQTGTGAEYITSDFIPVQPNTTYYKTQTLSPRTKFYDANKQVLDNSTYQDVSIGGNEGGFTTPSNAYYFRFTGNVNASTGININTTMVHKGSEATIYEAYTGASYPVNLGTMELCKIGNYQDYIYKEGKKWYKKEVIGKIKLVGNENWTYASSFPRFTAPYTGALLATSILNGDVYSDYYKVGQTSDTNYAISFWTNGSSKQVLIHDERFTTKGQFNTWLQSNNVTCYGIRYQTEDIEITDTTLISQLEALRNAESYEGQTNISQTNDDKPFILTAKALKDLSNL